jgi:hypothetical protein
MKTFRFIGLLAFLGVVIGGVLAWQYRAAAALRDEFNRRQYAGAEETRVKNEHARLLAQQVSPEELTRRREEREAWVALAGEIGALRSRLEAQTTGSAVPATPSQPRSMKELPRSAKEWRNAGQETPAAAFETVLWAAAGGEVEKLAAGLELDEATRLAAATIFNRLPAALQREVGTPEQLVALLTARDVPLGSAWILGEFNDQPKETKVATQLADAEGTKRDLLFTLREHEGRWRLVVPPQVMAKYTAFLRGQPVEPTAQ